MYIDKETRSDSKNTVSLFWPNDIVLDEEDEKYVILGYVINRFKKIIIDVIKKRNLKN